MSTHFTRLRLTTASLVVAAASVAVTALPAAAYVPPEMTASKTNVVAGESITITGDCTYDTVALVLYPGWTSDMAVPDYDPNAPSSIFSITPGAWSKSIIIPADAAPGDYTLVGICASEQPSYHYLNIKITVGAAEETTTTTLASSTTVTTTVAPTTTPAPAATMPAAAIPASPTYTG